MKNLSKLAVLGAALAVSSSLAFADTVTIGSFGTGTSAMGNINTSMVYAGYQAFPSPGTPPNDPQPFVAPSSVGGSTTTYNLASEGVWAPAGANSSYVGVATTAGPTGTSPVQTTTNPAWGYYTFTTTFTLNGTYGGVLNILADDTTEVFLNGTDAAHLLVPFGNLGGNGHCADGQPNCSISDSANLSLGAGSYTLYFVVEQAGQQTAGLDPSGVDFSASLGQTPEPSSLMLLGTGLVGAAGTMFRRRFAA